VTPLLDLRHADVGDGENQDHQSKKCGKERPVLGSEPPGLFVGWQGSHRSDYLDVVAAAVGSMAALDVLVTIAWCVLVITFGSLSNFASRRPCFTRRGG
jgi:hypothetical protein